jgi:hypothetical protein
MRTPVVAVWVVTTIGALLGLLVLAGPVAISAVFIIGAIAHYLASHWSHIAQARRCWRQVPAR